MIKPELITIVEGPTPEFRPSPQMVFQSIYEGPQDNAVAICEMRTGNGEDIRERCLRAWHEGRPVKLDFPDEMRLRQQVDVVALRLGQVEQGEVLTLWVNWPIDEDDEYDEFDEFDDFDDYDEEEYDEGEFDEGDDEFGY